MRRPGQRDELHADVRLVRAQFQRLEAFTGRVTAGFDGCGLGLELRVEVGQLLFDGFHGFAGAAHVLRLFDRTAHASSVMRTPRTNSSTK